jgi:hypothetical protein
MFITFTIFFWTGLFKARPWLKVYYFSPGLTLQVLYLPAGGILGHDVDLPQV